MILLGDPNSSVSSYWKSCVLPPPPSSIPMSYPYPLLIPSILSKLPSPRGLYNTVNLDRSKPPPSLPPPVLVNLQSRCDPTVNPSLLPLLLLFPSILGPVSSTVGFRVLVQEQGRREVGTSG